MNARHASHHTMPIRPTESAQPPTIPAALRTVAPGTGQAHRIELRCRSWQLGKAWPPSAPKTCCSLIVEVIILTTQRRAIFCGDNDTASLRGFPSGSGHLSYLTYLSPCYPLDFAVVTADQIDRAGGRACGRR